ncbi:hypothetical protein LCGC14_1282110 [marine sediment metagenome]|uniref:Uncharacterized protein n=1 Tax=marine sediment metagenome TaxID=412755 RepID=A0A0F9LFY4_9ZZZZ
MPQHPTEESMNITRKFLGGELGTPGQPPESQQVGRLPAQAAPIAGQRAFGQQGARKRPATQQGDSLGDRFLNLPGPVGFSKTPQGQAILQRILGGIGRRR